MLFLPLLCFAFLQVQNATALFDFLLGRQKICVCRCGIQRPVTQSWLSRDSVSPNQYPWLAAVEVGSRYISGVLLSDSHIVTAASPLYGVSSSEVTVTLGSRDRCGYGDDTSSHGADSILIHPSYSTTTSDNDIALIKLRNKVSFTNLISPVCLPIIGSDRSGKVASVASWGNYSSGSSCLPKVASLPLLSSDTCLTSSINVSMVTSDKGCLGPAGTTSVICSDDVGAPVMTQLLKNGAFRLVGIISSASCEQETTPLYTSISSHAAWIRQQIRSDCQCF
ncbi:chymotrypsinogen A-like [Ostrinia furnacalis]|nr:chymotrypsinogen A-like [Ostrinia furnacalis]